MILELNNIPFTDNDFNNLQWEEVPKNMRALNKELKGCEVIKVEPFDYPKTDSMSIYFKKPGKEELIILSVGSTEISEELFFCDIAHYKYNTHNK